MDKVDRETAVSMMKAISDIESLLEDVPHGIAKKIKSQMAAFEQVADDAFPGGYHCDCITCDEPIGHAESVAVGEEYICPSCWEKRKRDMAACEHSYLQETDVFGDTISHCEKCGYATESLPILA